MTVRISNNRGTHAGTTITICISKAGAKNIRIIVIIITSYKGGTGRELTIIINSDRASIVLVVNALVILILIINICTCRTYIDYRTSNSITIKFLF
ncbi:unnamed protein product [Rotaria sordida]|uniref:Uncharacterized protein n=1 Tax=Rotaria sordida TaxID=392033 RepID=A0A819VKP4_9BILA|nr:unnamed protein product [Rotaria sordida]CAF1382222.1 unnamed protein product [Rotaria sordida]CAF1398811.1 unnamed protein product [Rotaria sordida]CAF1569575.1 unnamed protein product [Rotaria sordida]CAF3983380.1 unnamed protein product [Rotaria sordida]